MLRVIGNLKWNPVVTGDRSLDSLHKGPVPVKACPYHDVIFSKSTAVSHDIHVLKWTDG